MKRVLGQCFKFQSLLWLCSLAILSAAQAQDQFDILNDPIFNKPPEAPRQSIDLRHLPPDMERTFRPKFAKAFGIPESKPERIDYLVHLLYEKRAQKRERKGKPSQNLSDAQEQRRNATPIYRHVKFSEGTAVPSAPQIERAFNMRTLRIMSDASKLMEQRKNNPTPPRRPRNTDDLKREYTKILSNRAGSTWDNAPGEHLPKLPKCSKNETHFVPFDKTKAALTSDNGKVLFDWLILPFEVPNHADEIFGINTFAMQYGTKESEGLSRIALSQGLFCLPHRLRASVSGIHHHIGSHALKNFDGKGRGELHDAMRVHASDYR